MAKAKKAKKNTINNNLRNALCPRFMLEKRKEEHNGKGLTQQTVLCLANASAVGDWGWAWDQAMSGLTKEERMKEESGEFVSSNREYIMCCLLLMMGYA